MSIQNRLKVTGERLDNFVELGMEGVPEKHQKEYTRLMQKANALAFEMHTLSTTVENTVQEMSSEIDEAKTEPMSRFAAVIQGFEQKRKNLRIIS